VDQGRPVHGLRDAPEDPAEGGMGTGERDERPVLVEPERLQPAAAERAPRGLRVIDEREQPVRAAGGPVGQHVADHRLRRRGQPVRAELPLARVAQVVHAPEPQAARRPPCRHR
jgi:hypothetical protein